LSIIPLSCFYKRLTALSVTPLGRIEEKEGPKELKKRGKKGSFRF